VSPGRLHWDGTVTAGNVIGAIALGLPLMVWAIRLEARVDRADERQARFEQVVAAQRGEDRASEAAAFVEVRGALRRIEDILLRQASERPPAR